MFTLLYLVLALHHHYLIKCLNKRSKIVCRLSTATAENKLMHLNFFTVVIYVSVSSNWVHRSPGEIFFEQANPGHSGIFLSNSLAQGKKMMVEFPGGGAKFSQTRRNCSVLSLQKTLKIKKTTRQQNHSKVFKFSSLDTQLKQIYTYINI